MISLDVFDTAIFRDVYLPQDIFKLIEERVGNDFYNKRRDAEYKAHLNNRNYNLLQIYSNIPEFDPNVEIEVEMDHCYANPVILDAYKSNPSNYVFISDMYLSSKVIEAMLEKCGYENPVVYVSSEAGCNKSTGELFTKVQELTLKTIDRHYGDNYSADIMGAQLAGVKAVYLPNIHDRKLNLPAVKNPILKKYIAEVECSHDDDITKLSKWFAPLIYDFTKWVISKRSKEQSIYFLSRDMGMNYHISKGILKEQNVHYIYVSRRSMAPFAKKLGNDKLYKKCKGCFSDKEFQKRIVDDPDLFVKYLKNTGIKDGDIIVDIGYSGSAQFAIEEALGIRLKGLYMQTPDELEWGGRVLNSERYLNRSVILYPLMTEFILGAPEDNVEGYDKDLKIIFRADSDRRKNYAKKVYKNLLDEKLYNKISSMKLSLYDIEQILIHIQVYPTEYMLKIYNESIYTNSNEDFESIINYDRDAIKNGKLIECFSHSYATPLFMKLLENDVEYAHLKSLIQDKIND